MKNTSEKKIIDCWHKNAKPWVHAVRKNEIESRVLVSNKAIVDQILACAPGSVLDIGCGEAWLVRELEKNNIKTLGVDVVEELIQSAQQTGIGTYITSDYESLSNNITVKSDVAVCNFSLIGKESVENVFEQVPSLLNKNGLLIIQTLHPVVSCGNAAYVEGWRAGSWAGFNTDFSDPSPWYFRTMDAWKKLFKDYDFKIEKIIEPIHPKTKQAVSIIFVASVMG